MLHLENEVTAIHNASAMDVIKEVMDYHHITQVDLAQRLGISQKHVSELLHRNGYMDATLAQRIEIVTGLSAKLLLNMDIDYQLHHVSDQSNNPHEKYLQRYQWAK